MIQSPLNYTGGKYKLLPQILPLFPKDINCFVDLFCGGCNVGINVCAKKYVYNDSCEPLINLYSVMQTLDSASFIEKIETVIKRYGLSDVKLYGYDFYNCNSSDGLGVYNRDKYMKLRADFNALKERNVDYYVMLYVLIVYAFNNQIRFNRNGEFNLPPGKRDFNQKMHSKVENFIELLQNQNATFIHSDFREIEIDKLTDKDFVYVDPPYLITCAAYNEQGGWSEVDEEDLLQKLDDLSQRGIKFALSNIYFKSRSQYIYPLPVDRTDNKQVFYNISILDEAIRKKQKVLFEYAEYHTDKKMHLKKREDGSVREYVVTPYQMAAQEGKYYLICNYDKYDDISNYRVDRIRNIQILEEKGKPFETLKWSGHQPMNLNEYMKEHVYMYSSENAFVKFRIVKAMISDVIDLFGKGVKFSEETDTHVSVSVHVNERAAEQFAKNYAPDVVILQPKRLRDKLRDDLKKAWEAYED